MAKNGCAILLPMALPCFCYQDVVRLVLTKISFI